jgi:hypothetical protein
MRKVVSRPTAKGAASTAVTRAIPKPMWRDCRACKASHISDSAMRTSSLPAGLELQPGTSPPVLQRVKGSKLVTKPQPVGLTRLARAYLRLLGPATAVQVADYLDVRRPDLEPYWPDDLIEVQIGRATAFLPAECRQAFEQAPDPEPVRLLSGFDPYLQARDRDLIVPDKAVQKALWPVLGRPGAVFADGEVVGTWRPKASGGKLTITVEEFAPLAPTVRDQLGAEGERVAAVRGLTLQRVG